MRKPGNQPSCIAWRVSENEPVMLAWLAMIVATINRTGWLGDQDSNLAWWSQRPARAFDLLLPNAWRIVNLTIAGVILGVCLLAVCIGVVSIGKFELNF